jgi:hypothetical protein
MSQWTQLGVSQWTCHEYFTEHVHAVQNILTFLQGRQLPHDALAFRLRVLTSSSNFPPIETHPSQWLHLIMFEASFTEKSLRNLSAHDKCTLHMDFPNTDEFCSEICVPLLFYNTIILGLHEILRDRLIHIAKPDAVGASTELVWWYLAYFSKSTAIHSLIHARFQQRLKHHHKSTSGAVTDVTISPSVSDLIYIAVPEKTASLWNEHRQLGYARWKKAVAFDDVEHNIKKTLNLP